MKAAGILLLKDNAHNRFTNLFQRIEIGYDFSQFITPCIVIDKWAGFRMSIKLLWFYIVYSFDKRNK